MNSEIAILGYLTTLERLRLEIEPTPPMEGGVGRRIIPTITCDAPIIGLGLSAAGYKVEAAFNHPGNTKQAFAALELLQSYLDSCHFGPESGTPLALQVISRNNKIKWFADPSYGLRSLEEVSTNLLQGEWLYFDAYPWIVNTVEKKLLDTTSKKGVFINFGTISQENLFSRVAQWRQRFKSKFLVFQASMGQGNTLSLSELSSVAQEALSKGSDIVLITVGEAGLVIGKDNQVAMAKGCTLPNKDFVDSSGAGAAVSIELIKILLSGSLNNLDEIASLLAIAGANQCLISGALDSLNQKVWNQILEASCLHE